MAFFRVFVHHPDARGPRDNGHPLFVWPRQGAGRLDDPAGEYRVLYLAATAEAAVAETLGRYPRWTPQVLAGPPAAPAGSTLALARYDGTPQVLDLDDARRLVTWRLRPSSVVTRDRAVTQAWARRIHLAGEWDGVSWWSAYDATWTVLGLWRYGTLTVAEVEPLSLTHPALTAAAERLMRPLARR